MKRFIAFILMAFALSMANGTGAERLTDPTGGTGGGPISGSLHVKVIQHGTATPMSGAFVMAGTAVGRPFPGNFGFTSPTGEITFNHAKLQGAITVTAGTAGYQYFTVVEVNANDLVIPLKPLAAPGQTFQVGDKVSGIDVDNGLFNFGDGNIDMAFVFNALSLDDLWSFDMTSMMGPLEPIDVAGNIFEVPSNMYVPQQYEILQEIIKDHYYIYLPAGNHTLTALSGRVSMTDLLNTTNMLELIPLLNWREADILNVNVTGNTNAADLNVAPDLTTTVTLNLANVPVGTTAWCLSIGDLDGLNGLGRLIAQGLNMLDNSTGTGPASASRTMTTTAATGEFAGMGYFPVTALEYVNSSDMVVIARRDSHAQTYTENMSDFFRRLALGYGDGTFSWNDVENSATGSPGVDLHAMTLTNPANQKRVWEFVVPGHKLNLQVPKLPHKTPANITEGMILTWSHSSFGLTYDLPSFDYNNFAFGDISGHGSHIALDNMNIEWPKAKFTTRFSGTAGNHP